MLEEIKKILSKQLRIEPEKITEASKIKDDLGADSLDIVQILMTIEEEYNITIPDEKLAELVSVGDIISYLNSLK